MFAIILALLSLFIELELVGTTADPKRDTQSFTTLSQAQIEAFKPYSFYAAAAYCSPAETLTWSCGRFCDANPTFRPFASGGDGSATQFWFVGFDSNLSSIVVAIQGTVPFKFLADLTDFNLFLTDLDQQFFPGLPSTIQVHRGFAKEQKKSGPAILEAVQSLITQHGQSTPIIITGHSLGAALALLNTVYLSLHLPAGSPLSVIGFGMPRVGNGHFADYVDATANVTRVNNREDPIAILPPRFLGFRHCSGEIHIEEGSGAWIVCSGQDNPSTHCSVGDMPSILQGNILNHLGSYDDGISMGLC